MHHGGEDLGGVGVGGAVEAVVSILHLQDLIGRNVCMSSESCVANLHIVVRNILFSELFGQSLD